MSEFAISFAAFCTAGQHRTESTTRCIEAAQDWSARHGYALEQYQELEHVGTAPCAAAAVILGCLQLIRHRLERGDIAPGAVLILETLNGLPRDAVRPAISILMDLMRHGLALVTLRDGRLWSPTAVEDFGAFVMSIALLSGEYPGSDAIPKAGG